MKSKRLLLCLLSVFVFSLPALIGGSNTARAADPTPTATPIQEIRVDIKDLVFSPSTINIPVNSRVTWTSSDVEAHTVTATSPAGAFDSGIFNQNQSFSMVFDKLGTYDYTCTLHPFMKGKVIVSLDGGPSGGGKPLRLWGQPIYLWLGMLSGAAVFGAVSLSTIAKRKKKPKLFKWHRRLGYVAAIIVSSHIILAVLARYYGILA